MPNLIRFLTNGIAFLIGYGRLYPLFNLWSKRRFIFHLKPFFALIFRQIPIKQMLIFLHQPNEITLAQFLTFLLQLFLRLYAVGLGSDGTTIWLFDDFGNQLFDIFVVGFFGQDGIGEGVCEHRFDVSHIIFFIFSSEQSHSIIAHIAVYVERISFIASAFEELYRSLDVGMLLRQWRQGSACLPWRLYRHLTFLLISESYSLEGYQIVANERMGRLVRVFIEGT